ncbi:hypothetical protein MKZ38_008382 [Zalerion maritima]|uniref:Uncharacterized protein n=1 Tax=Zalerion maritima TaxID=339359 RepID=A0AAD5RGT2_9PEZI|nr:hypothetical protein MKZ38_008382 [Zalerion maritima]
MCRSRVTLTTRLTQWCNGGESRVRFAVVTPSRLSSHYTAPPGTRLKFSGSGNVYGLPGSTAFSPTRFGTRTHNVISCLPAARTKRSLSAEALISPPLYFFGLLASLWTWKCLMMVVFQNKIIYIPGMPPNSRRETIRDYAAQCVGVRWEEHRTRASDGTDLALCVASVSSTDTTGDPSQTGENPVYILYFHGNASSLPPRLPLLSHVLRSIKSQSSAKSSVSIRYTMVCLSYRGYWTSRGRPSEDGITRDAIAAMSWISHLQDKLSSSHIEAGDKIQAQVQAELAPVIVWGASIGAAFATGLAANVKACPANLHISSLCLETPFTSIRDMLVAMYPQKWVPYKHLWPFLRNHLDNYKNLQVLANNCRLNGTHCPHIFLLHAGKDEIVPSEHGDRLFARCVDLGFDVERHSVAGAFHNDATFRPRGRQELAAAIVREAQRAVESRSAPAASSVSSTYTSKPVPHV